MGVTGFIKSIFGANTPKVVVDRAELIELLESSGNEHLARSVRVIFEDINEQIGYLKAIRQSGFKMDKLLTGFYAAKKIIYNAVILVEAYALVLKDLSGSEKRKSVIEYLDNTIEFPWPLEMFDSFVWGKLIDAAVAQLNSDKGKQFVSDILARSEDVKKILNQQVVEKTLLEKFQVE